MGTRGRDSLAPGKQLGRASEEREEPVGELGPLKTWERTPRDQVRGRCSGTEEWRFLRGRAGLGNDSVTRRGFVEGKKSPLRAG